MYWKSESGRFQDTQSKYKVVIFGSKGEEAKEKKRFGAVLPSGDFHSCCPILIHLLFKKKHSGVKVIFYVFEAREPQV